MVELEHATKSLTAFAPAITVSRNFARLNQLIAESLMVAFGVVIRSKPHVGFYLANRTIASTITCRIRGRPGFRLSLESNVFATRFRCHRRIVFGVKMVVISRSALRPMA